MTTPGLSVPVSAPGLAETTQGFTNLGTQATQATGGMTKAAGAVDNFSRSTQRAATSISKTNDAFGGLSSKLRSGEVLRNGAASFALLSTAGDGAIDKIAALGGAFAAIPGPVGIAASAIAVGATVLNVFIKNAEEAEKATQALKASLVDLGKQRIVAQDTLAARIGGAAAKIGPDLLANIARGGGGKTRRQDLFGGDIVAGLQYGAKMASSGLDAASQEKVDKALKDQANAGERITSEMQDRAIAVIKEAQQNSSGGDNTLEVAAARDAQARRGGGIFGAGATDIRGQMVNEQVGTRSDTFMQIQDPGSTNAEQVNRMFVNSTGAEGQRAAGALDTANAPAIAEAMRTVSDATNVYGMSSDALKGATERNTESTNELTKAITDLDAKIKATTAQIKGPANNQLTDTGGNFGAGWWGSRSASATAQ